MPTRKSSGVAASAFVPDNGGDHSGGGVDTVPGESMWTSDGTFIVPDDVREVSVVCVGGTNGSAPAPTEAGSAGTPGGALSYGTFPVAPGESLIITVGIQDGYSAATYTSSVKRGTTTLLSAGRYNAVGGIKREGGGYGGAGGAGTATGDAGGGGGAGGYSGNGGVGATYGGGNNNGGTGTGGAGGGGGASGSGTCHGGGVGVEGEGPSGSCYAPTSAGGVGSYGARYYTGNSVAVAQLFGGGAAGQRRWSQTGKSSAQGAVRIVWGFKRTYPNFERCRYENSVYGYLNGTLDFDYRNSAPTPTDYTESEVDYRGYKFTSAGALTTDDIPAGKTVEYFIVGGGGAGGGGDSFNSSHGGGGGGGEVQEGTFIMPANGGVMCAIGEGGKCLVKGTIGHNGSPSSLYLYGQDQDPIVAIGGGTGGAFSGDGGRSGGSGGGGSNWQNANSAGSAIGTGYGNSGGTGKRNTAYAGGGGGAGSAGVDATDASSGAGGSGRSSSIDAGFSVSYGGGGGGGNSGAGTDGGGAGGAPGNNGVDGTANQGGGGGGGGSNGSTSNFGGAGGSGVVLLRYVR